MPNQLRQLTLAHSRELLRDRRGTVTMLLVFGGMVIGLMTLDLLVFEQNQIRFPGAIMGAGILANSLPLIALIGFSSLSLVSTAVPLTAYRANGILRQFGATPVSRIWFLLAHLPFRFALGALQIAVLLVLTVFFVTPSIAALARITLLLFCALSMLLGVGYLIGARLRDPERTLGLSFILTLALIATSGTALPLSSLPGPLRSALSWLPTTQFTQTMSAELTVIDPPSQVFWAVVLLLSGAAAVLFTCSVRFLSWASEYS